MALQTREQHIKRDRATSNICTAQVLLAVMAGMYAVYHGPKGLQYIADTVHYSTTSLASQLEKLGYKQVNSAYFDTLQVKADAEKIRSELLISRPQCPYQVSTPITPYEALRISCDIFVNVKAPGAR